jgi:hypothetical protein
MNFSHTWFFRFTGYKQMKLKLTRLDATDYGIFGHLTCDGSPFNCVTLENHLLAVPAGAYKVTLYDSPEWGYKVPLLQDVPNRTFIEIHKGNWQHNSRGCILVGKERDGQAIDASGDAFEELMTVLKDCNDISITIL